MREFIYRIFERKTNKNCGAYNRSYGTQYDFDSIGDARSSMFNKEYKNEEKYRIAKYKVILINEDIDKED